MDFLISIHLTQEALSLLIGLTGVGSGGLIALRRHRRKRRGRGE